MPQSTLRSRLLKNNDQGPASTQPGLNYLSVFERFRPERRGDANLTQSGSDDLTAIQRGRFAGCGGVPWLASRSSA